MEQPTPFIVQPTRFQSTGSESAAIVAEGRVLDAVATEAMHGTLEEIATMLGLSVNQLRAAVTELASIGWVEVTQRSDGALSLDLALDAR